MSSVIKRNGTWYLKYRNADGKRVRRASKASTKAEAKRLADELERKCERQRLGLEPRDDAFAEVTVGAVLDWYIDTYLKGRPSQEPAQRAARLHLKPALGDIPLAKLTAGHVEELLQAKSETLSSQSVNHLRGYLVRAINKARRAGKFRGDNVAEATEARKIVRPVFDYLRADEVPQFLRGLSTWWRRWYAVRLYTGLRRGEAAALRRRHVDLDKRLIRVEASYERETTKGGHADFIPIADELVPYLEELVAQTKRPDDLLFPASDGGMLPRDFKEVTVFRRALVRAGIVTHYTHVCRRPTCRYTEQRADDEVRPCPRCGFKLWPKGHPKPIRPYDLRATFVSLLVQAGVSLDVAAKLARHEDWRTTARHYARFAPDYMHTEVNKLRLVATPAPAPELPGRGPFGVHVGEGESRRAEPRSGNAGNSAQFLERATGFEPATPSLGSKTEASPSVTDARKSLNSQHFQIQPSPASPADPNKKQIAGSIWGPRTPELRLRVDEGAGETLLTVREVAQRLKVSRATVYSLVARGKLPHVRVSNAIRFRRADLEAFIVAGEGER